jgi:hypothetical protein
MLVAGAVLAWCAPAEAQAECGASGYRVIALRWDGVLRRGWELRQDCAHPEWPARLIAAAALGSSPTGGASRSAVTAATVQPLLVRAGDLVTLWEQDATVRIERSGIAEQSARAGERVVVRITRRSDDAGLTVDRIGGIVRGAGNVEVER